MVVMEQAQGAVELEWKWMEQAGLVELAVALAVAVMVLWVLTVSEAACGATGRALEVLHCQATASPVFVG